MLNTDPNSDKILNEKTKDKMIDGSEKKEPFENSLSVEIRILGGHLDNLYSDQVCLNVLSRHLARRTSQIHSLSNSEKINVSSLFAALDSIASLSEEETSEKPIHPIPGIEKVSINESPDSFLDRILDVNQSNELPPMQIRCNSSHWQSLYKVALSIHDALLSLSRYHGHESVEDNPPVAATTEDEAVESQSESERFDAMVSRRIAQSTGKVRDEANPETDGFFLKQLQRELESLIRLVRCAASLCSILSDFNAANIKADGASGSDESDISFFARVSRAIAWVNNSLDKRANEIEVSADFLARYTEKNPGIAPKAIEVKEITRFCRKVREDVAADQSNRLFNPREIGEYFLDRNPDTARSLIAEMEKDEIEGPHLKGSNGLYTRKQGMRMIRFYENKPGRWRNR